MIIIEGLIGVGKSTLAKQIEKKIPGSILYSEKVDKNPYLEKFYQDPERYALLMQYMCLSDRFTGHRKAIKQEWYEGKITIHDRSIYADEVFAKVCHSDGYIDDLGLKAYLQLKECMEDFLLMPHQIIFLDVTPQKALERKNKRNRGCESGITLEYLSKLRGEYIKLLDKLEKKGAYITHYDWQDGMTVEDIEIAKGAMHCGIKQFENIKE